MIKIFSIVFLFAGLSFSGFAQTTYGVTPPDSIKMKCDKVIISEIGKKAFDANIHYIKSDSQKGVYPTGENWISYTLFYSFNFPNIKQSHVIFSLNYKKDLTKSAVMKDIAFKNYTRLPESIKSKGTKAVSYEEAKKAAMEAEPVLKANPTKLYGEISTEYDEIKKEYVFVWYFYFMEPNKKSEAEQYTTYSVLIDAGTGKIIKADKGKPE